MGQSKSARCDDLESLKKSKCAANKIENPRGSIAVNKDKPVTNRKDVAEKLKPEDITQIQPQKLTLTLRSGKYSTSAAKSFSALPEREKSLAATVNILVVYWCVVSGKTSLSQPSISSGAKLEVIISV